MPTPPAADDPVDSGGPTFPRAGSGVRAMGGDTLFKAGDRVAENIQLVSLLGVGGMGDVWLANHIGLDTAVAVKFMSAALAHDRALIERFAREAKLASRIKSPHVVQIFDFATTHEGIPYIVMELIEGETLESRIQRSPTVGLDETSRIVVQLCRALNKAHEAGIIHRDMKPDNVLLGKEEGELFVRILDFGIAKHVDAPKGITDAGATMGTPSYMSPEQLFRQADVDYRSDLWALGVMTYQCLTGTLPFPGETFAAACVAINEGRYPVASKVNDEIPPALDAWFGRAMAVSPDDRFGSAKEMSDAYLLILEESHRLPVWAVRKEGGDSEAPSYAAGTGSVPATLLPARHVRGSRRRAAAIVLGAAMLVAVGFLSRDATLGHFVKAHIPARGAHWVDRLGAEAASQVPPAPSRMEAPEALSAEAPSPEAAAPMAKVTLPRPIAWAAPVVPPRARAIPAPTGGSPSIERPPSEPIASASSEPESPESNPYSESGAPPAGTASAPSDTPEPVVPRRRDGVEPHAPSL